MLLPFQGAIMRMGFTQGVALGYGLLGFQPVSRPTDGIASPFLLRGIHASITFYARSPPNDGNPARICRAG